MPSVGAQEAPREAQTRPRRHQDAWATHFIDNEFGGSAHGRMIIIYSWGNQRGEEYLAEANYEGTLEQFLTKRRVFSARQSLFAQIDWSWQELCEY